MIVLFEMLHVFRCDMDSMNSYCDRVEVMFFSLYFLCLFIQYLPVMCWKTRMVWIVS